MRSSTNKDDPGFETWSADPKRWKAAVIRVNGVRVKDVETLDTDEGFVRRYQRDNEDNIVVDFDKGIFPTEELRGKVTVDFDGEV